MADGLVELVSRDPARDGGPLDERVDEHGDELLDALHEVLLDVVRGLARAVEERLGELGDDLDVLRRRERVVGVVLHLGVLVRRGSAGGLDGGHRRLGRIAAGGVAGEGLLAVVGAHGGDAPVL